MRLHTFSADSSDEEPDPDDEEDDTDEDGERGVFSSTFAPSLPPFGASSAFAASPAANSAIGSSPWACCTFGSAGTLPSPIASSFRTATGAVAAGGALLPATFRGILVTPIGVVRVDLLCESSELRKKKG